MRTIIDYEPFEDVSKMWGDRGRWPAKWVVHPKVDGQAPAVQVFRRTFSIDRPRTVRIHVSADERYELFLDGQRIGRGPERGDRSNWFFETYDLPLNAGQHVIVARSWWLGDQGFVPFAQASVRPGFVVAAEGEDGKLLSTGVAAWDAKLLNVRHLPPGPGQAVGGKVHLIGRGYAFDFARGEGADWVAVKNVDWAVGPELFGDQPPTPILRPAMLPPMLEETVRVGRARHVQRMDGVPMGETLVRSADHLSNEAAGWDALLAGKSPLTIPPKTVRRVIIDLENYFCAYTDLVTSGGDGSRIQTAWAESLYLPEDPKAADQPRGKGNRDEIEGKTFRGVANVFEPDGGAGRAFDTLWWEAGRYIELIVTTADQPLTIDRLSFRQTHYPLDWTSQFDCDDDRFGQLTPITRRVMEMCSHETYMDCPYYEQLQYIGDTRLEVLTTYACCRDDRLARKALRLFESSRVWPGFTASRAPARVPQCIPPFSAWWVAMVHDFAMWRDDPAVVKAMLPGVRSVMDQFLKSATPEGLIAGPSGWNFVDWVPGWNAGMPEGGNTGDVTAALNFQLAWVFRQAAQLEDHFGEPELAALNRRRSAAIIKAAEVFWDEDRGLYADDLRHRRFSEHAQCLALLAGTVDDTRRPRLIDHLFTDHRLDATTIYFSHYLFETCAQAGRPEPMFERLKMWFGLKALGFKTTLESPEPSRSDCHAWGAHPMFHFHATILGIRPAAMGFKNVEIRPQLGPLKWAKGSMVHPKGLIEVEVRRETDGIHGRVKLPDGVDGVVHVNGQRQAIDGASLSF